MDSECCTPPPSAERRVKDALRELAECRRKDTPHADGRRHQVLMRTV
jgi:hypothetical protein